MMLSCSQPPHPGEYVAIRIDGLEVAGRVMWRNGTKFGVWTRERVISPPGARGGNLDEKAAHAHSESARPISISEVHAGAAALSNAMQWIIVCTAGAILAFGIGGTVAAKILDMSVSVTAGLAQHPGDSPSRNTSGGASPARQGAVEAHQADTT
jgi:hypothetical protein